MDNKNKVKQDGYKVNIDSKYTPWVKLGLAALTAAGLLGGKFIHYFTPLTFRSNRTSPTVLLS
jgi:hypothetical protein